MGSQNVTNFSAVRMARIGNAIKDYASKIRAPEVAWEAAASAIGPLNKSNSFIQGLSSRSAERALNELISLAERFRSAKGRKELEDVLKTYSIDPKARKPLHNLISASVTETVLDKLSARSEKTDSATAAQDAITRTVIDVISESVPRKKVDTASPEQIARAFEKVGKPGLTEIFLRNILSSLMGLTIDAARGEVGPRVAKQIVEASSYDTGIAARLSHEIVSAAPQKPTKVLAMISRPRLLKKLEGIRKTPPAPPEDVGKDITSGVINGGKKNGGKK